MGILTRFKDIMSSNINALLDKAEDPEKMIDQCLRNLNSDLGKVKSETAAIMADEQRAKRKLDECKDEITKIQNYAAKAVSAGNDSDARLFLEKKQTLVAKQAELQQIYDAAHARTQEHINEMVSSSNGANSSISAVERMEEKADQMLDKANAMAQLNNAGHDEIDDLKAKYDSAPGTNSDIEDELAALKASLGK